MEAVLAAHLERLVPALKQRWAARLQRTPAGPDGAGLVTPDMLVPMIERTLLQLTKAAVTRPSSSGGFARFVRQPAVCQCGLHLLIRYYSAGAWALRDALPADLGAGRVRLISSFVRLARYEMDFLCGNCLHRGGSLCQRSSAPGPAGHPGSSPVP